MAVCQHPVKLKVSNVTAIIAGGSLTSGDPDRAIRYELIEFCARPSCEHVFRAERAR